MQELRLYIYDFSGMVIPSDITRWGFVQHPATESDLQGEPLMDNFVSGKWLMGVSNAPAPGSWRRVIIYYEGKLKQRDYLSGPGDVHNFLKKVGYL